MKQDLLISASILDANFLCLGEEIEKIAKTDVDWIHLDIMDGHFVENISFGPSLVALLREKTKKILDCHLMISDPDRFLNAFSESGCDRITFHAEASPDMKKTVRTIKDLGKKAGVAINPQTQETVLESILNEIDLILIMGVYPGFGGQKLIFDVIEKIKRIKKRIEKRPILLSIDGGVNCSNAPILRKAGIDIFAVGSAIFKGEKEETYQDRIKKLRQAAYS